MIPWIAAARPKTLMAGAVPVAVGSALAWREGQFRPSVFWAALFGALFIQIGTNYVNDASDFLRGADNEERLGPKRMAQSGLLTPKALFMGAAVFFLMASVCGAHLIQMAGWPMLWIGVASILFAVAYTAGPFPLAYLGLGDLFVLIFFGWVAVLGTVFAHMGVVSQTAIVVATIVGLQAAALIAVNNIRDIPTDMKAGKRTLAVKMGAGVSRIYFSAITLVPFAVTPLLVRDFGWWTLAILVALPFAVENIFRLKDARTGDDFNQLLGAAARVQVIYSIGLIVGMVLD